MGIAGNRLWFFLYVLVTGQLTSLTLTGLNVFATLFSNHTGKDISTTLSAGAYFILAVTAGPCVAYQPGFVDKLKQYWWKFMIIAPADFYSTYLQTLALRYTSVSSSMLITTGFYTLFVVILSLFMIKTRYKLIHYASIIISTIGMVIVVWQDLVKTKHAGRDPVLGDMLCVGGGTLFAVATVSEELLIKGNLNILDFLALLGFSGTFVSSIQLCVLDRIPLVEVEWDLKAVLYFHGCQMCNYLYYVFFALLIIKSSSVVASLSTLTSNVYSLIFAIFLFNNTFSIFYIGGFIIIMIGLFLYNVVRIPEGDTDQSVFSVGFWYNYGHSLFCEWRCCPERHNVNINNTNNNGHGHGYGTALSRCNNDQSLIINS